MTNQQLDIMLDWIINKMQFDKWYPISSNTALEAINLLWGENAIDNCELNDNKTMFRKIKTNFPKKLKHDTKNRLQRTKPT